MSLHDSYDPENIFVKIVRGDMPSVKIAETEDTLAFMDIFPQTRGHCLVIHKSAPATNILDIETPALQRLTEEVQRIARAVEKSLKPDGIRIVQFNGAPAGQTVFHLHFHIIPMFDGEPMGQHAGGAPADTADLQALADQISEAL